ncbi:hypothetical protein DBY65_025075 [Pseudomonas sp. RIT412]|nr:hypothetical protein DBP26_024440 [Pseudomonas sp. RIT 409]RAU47819.1 hypothetical protein DBY65_025075 [Pseudomonas sp. RIT 412]
MLMGSASCHGWGQSSDEPGVCISTIKAPVAAPCVAVMAGVHTRGMRINPMDQRAFARRALLAANADQGYD